MATVATIRGRYDVREVLGQGGMGVVYAAYDKVVKRLVAVKTIRDIPDPLALELFQRESQVLADLSHPNIVEMFDIGEFSDDAFTKPYFVMPLLRGATLDQLMMAHDGSLSPSRSIDIITQACRGLYAAHESGLVHRDLKPSNIFVLDDDSVKIIDFGVAHLLSNGTTLGAKGTPHYMAPEQLEMGGATPLSDQFSMGVVAYQLLAGKLPFEGLTAREVARSVVNTVPRALFESNAGISLAVSQVIAKALAKKPANRFATIKEFSDSLQRAFLHNKPLPVFDTQRLIPRIARAERAIAAGDIVFAEEITSELEDEGSLHESVTSLRRKLDTEKKRSGVDRLVAEARHRFRESEYSLALEKAEEALRLDPDHAAAETLRREIENKRDEQLIEQWFQLAERSREHREYDRAQESIARILKVSPTDIRAQRLQAELKVDEAEYRKRCEERDRLHRAATNAWREGDLAVALNRLERAKQLDPDGETEEIRESLSRLRQEMARLNDAQTEIGELLAKGEASNALATCDTWLQKYPHQALLQSLRLTALEAKRQQIAAYATEIDAHVAAENDLERRVEILEQAAARYPDEQHFQNALRAAGERRDLIAQLRRRAAEFERSNEWAEALEQWNLIGEIHPEYPKLAENKLRMKRRGEQYSEAEEKARWVRRIDRELEAQRYDAALDLIRQGRQRFPGDPELEELERQADTRRTRRQQTETQLDRGRALCESGDIEAGTRLLREARTANAHDATFGARILQILAREAERIAPADPGRAAHLLEEAAAIDANAPAVKALKKQLAENNREERIMALLARARRHQTEGDLPAATVVVQDGLAEFPADPRLENLLSTLTRKLDLSRTTYERELEELKAAVAKASGASTPQRERFELLRKALGETREEKAQAERKRREAERAAAARKDEAAAKAFPVPSAYSKPSRKLLLWAALVAAAAAILSISILLLRRTPERATTQRAVEPSSPPATKTEEAAITAPAVGPPLRIFADAPDFSASVDGQTEQALTNGGLHVDHLLPGQHTLSVSAADGGKVTFALDTSHDGPISSPDTSGKGLIGIAGRVSGGSLQLASSQPGIAVSLDNGSYRRIGSDYSQPFSGSGVHVLKFADGAESWPVTLSDNDQALAIVHAPKGGSVTIRTGQDDAEIYINGVKLKRLTRNGALRVANLAPQFYAVRAVKEGFEDQTGELTIETGKQSTLDLPLMPKPPSVASLEIKGGTPGAEVIVDGAPVGEIGSDGALLTSRLQPGNHQVLIRKAKFISKSETYKVNPGEKLTVSGSDALLEPVPAPPASIRFDVTPASASIQLKNAKGDSIPGVHSGQPVSVPAGAYNVIVSAPGYTTQEQRIELASNFARKIGMYLMPEPQKRKTDILAGWEDASGWTREGSIAVRHGGGMVFYGHTRLAGNIRFQVNLRRGKRLEWFLHFKSPEHYCRFEADKQYLYRIEVANGKATELAKKAYGAGDGKMFLVEISIRNGSVIHRINGQVVDTWNDPQIDFSDGSFGFIVPGRSGFGLLGATEIALLNFSFDPTQ